MDRDTGDSVVGAKAELVCKAPFVAAPVCFFGDDEAKSKYRGAYFEKNDGVWCAPARPTADRARAPLRPRRAAHAATPSRADADAAPAPLPVGTTVTWWR